MGLACGLRSLAAGNRRQARRRVGRSRHGGMPDNPQYLSDGGLPGTKTDISLSDPASRTASPPARAGSRAPDPRAAR